jgi:hypothetical protein
MIAPDKTVRDVPASKKDEYIKIGGRPAITVFDNKGVPRWIPEDMKDEFLKPSMGGSLPVDYLKRQSDPSRGEGTYDMEHVGPVPFSKVDLAKKLGYTKFANEDDYRRYRKYLDYSQKAKGKSTPSSEGIFELYGLGGKVEPVPYSQVLDKIKSGYKFPDEDKMYEFRKDYIADRNEGAGSAKSKYNVLDMESILRSGTPSYSAYRVPEGTGSFERWMHQRGMDPVTGIIKTGAGLAAGLENTVRSGLNRLPGLETPETPEARAMRSFAESPDISQEVELGKVVGDIAEFVSGEEVLGALESGGLSALQKIPSIAKVAPKISQMAEDYKKTSSALHWGYDSAKQGMVAGIQTYLHTQDEKAAKEAFLVTAAVSSAFSAGFAGLKKAAPAAKDLFYKTLKVLLNRSEFDVEAIVNKVEGENESIRGKVREAHQQKVAMEGEAKKAIDERTRVRQKVVDNVRARYNKVRDQINKQYDVVRNAVGNATVPTEELANTVRDAKDQDLKGSKDHIPQFESMLKSASDEAEKLAFRDEVCKSAIAGRPYDQLNEIQKQRVDKYVEDNFTPSSDDKGISFDHIRGYRTELYRRAQYLPPGSGDVYRAISRVMGKLDDMAQKMADNANVGDELRRANSDYRKMSEVFHSPSGVKDVRSGQRGSANPLSRMMPKSGVRATEESPANVDLYDATRHLVSSDPDSQERLIKDFVGQPGDIHYSPESEATARELIDSERSVDEATREELSARSSYRSASKAKETVATPDEIHKRRISEIGRVAERYGDVSRFQAALVARTVSGGIVGGLAGVLSPKGSKRNWAAVSGVAGWLAGPKVIAMILESPEIKKEISRVTVEDAYKLASLMKSQPELYKSVKDVIERMEAEAHRSGVISGAKKWEKVFSLIEGRAKTAASVGAYEHVKKEDLEDVEQNVANDSGHVFHVGTFKQYHPNATDEDVEEAKKQARDAGHEVVE